MYAISTGCREHFFCCTFTTKKVLLLNFGGEQKGVFLQRGFSEDHDEGEDLKYPFLWVKLIER